MHIQLDVSIGYQRDIMMSISDLQILKEIIQMKINLNLLKQVMVDQQLKIEQIHYMIELEQ